MTILFNMLSRISSKKSIKSLKNSEKWLEAHLLFLPDKSMICESQALCPTTTVLLLLHSINHTPLNPAL